MKTKHDIKTASRGGLPFNLAKGTAVYRIPADKMYGRAPNQCYWVVPEALPPYSIMRHDATYYGIEVCEEDVEA